MVTSVDSVECKDLAVSLDLNLVACALKLGFFHRVLDLCSLVININPNNIKTRFRRAKAAIELGFMARGFEELTMVVHLDPTNKEIQNELGKVELIYQSSIKVCRSLIALILPGKLGMVRYVEDGVWFPIVWSKEMRRR